VKRLIAANVLFDKIFDRYFRVPGTKEGTGLGLAIAKAIVEAHGGTIQVASTLGSGTTFTIIMPVAEQKVVV
jgi:signal transduction histidine kinase